MTIKKKTQGAFPVFEVGVDEECHVPHSFEQTQVFRYVVENDVFRQRQLEEVFQLVDTFALLYESLQLLVVFINR